jgi:hypothetical protein
MIKPFSYSPTIINALERALSPERLSTYLAAANGDHAAALRLYVWNTEISAALYGPLQALEILVRNAFHRELSAVYGPTWYDNPQVPLTPPARARGGRGKILTAIPARPASTESRNSHPADDHNFLPDAPYNYVKFRQLPRCGHP